ncbi:MAG: NAD(P)H-binding protein [Polyangiaceae bacterium]
MRVVIFGATGMIGHGVLLECLDDPAITAVTSVARREVPVEHDKLTQILHDDFTDFRGIADALTGFDACFWCLGVSSTGMTEEAYRRITLDFTLAAAEVLAERNDALTFCFISGAGTDRDSRQMWARVKAEAEDRLADFPFAAHYNFRPAMIQPMRGVRSTIKSYNLIYAIIGPFYPLLKHIRSYVTSTPEVGRAMIRVARDGAPKQILENADICELAGG